MSALHDVRSVPALTFAIDGCAAVPYAAAPTLGFSVRVQASDDFPIRSLLLDVQIQIAARRRAYGDGEQARLLELFGPPGEWRTTLRTLPWLRTTAVVPPFTGHTLVDLAVPCTYDLEVSGARYFAALDEGEVPLEFLFSGTVFFTDNDPAHPHLQAARIPWDGDVDAAMPVAVWREAVDRHFPDAAWLRLQAGTFNRLCAYKGRHAFVTLDEALAALLDGHAAP